jgi:glycosyltransferase involved in cell wall biosynthesis
MNTPAIALEPAIVAAAADEPPGTCQVEIVVPVKDEENDLAPSIRRLQAFLADGFPFTARVTIADNGSTDGTWDIALGLAAELPGVAAIRLEQPGRGRALRSIWSRSSADVLAYMDVDLSTDLNALLPLVAPLLSGHSDVAIGTRLARGSRVVRGPRREMISRGYNLLLQATLGARFSDAQCGFKAIRRDKARELLPRTQDGGWFFDTELLVLAERAGLRIHEVPVDWTDDPDSRVNVRATALADIRGILRMGGGHRLARFVAVGAASTLAYLLIYLALRRGLAAQAARRHCSWPPVRPSCRSAASTARTRRRPWRSSSSWWPSARSTISSARTPTASAAVPVPRRPSPSGWRRTSRRRPWAAKPSTT